MLTTHRLPARSNDGPSRKQSRGTWLCLRIAAPLARMLSGTRANTSAWITGGAANMAISSWFSRLLRGLRARCNVEQPAREDDDEPGNPHPEPRRARCAHRALRRPAADVDVEGSRLGA